MRAKVGIQPDLQVEPAVSLIALAPGYAGVRIDRTLLTIQILKKVHDVKKAPSAHPAACGQRVSIADLISILTGRSSDRRSFAHCSSTDLAYISADNVRGTPFLLERG